MDPDKLDAMAATGYQNMREILGLGSEDFRLTVAENWSGVPRVLYQKGVEESSSERAIVRRYALLNGTRVEVKLEAYYDR